MDSHISEMKLKKKPVHDMSIFHLFIESILYRVFEVIFQKLFCPNDGLDEQRTYKIVLKSF